VTALLNLPHNRSKVRQPIPGYHLRLRYHDSYTLVGIEHWLQQAEEVRFDSRECGRSLEGLNDVEIASRKDHDRRMRVWVIRWEKDSWIREVPLQAYSSVSLSTETTGIPRQSSLRHILLFPDTDRHPLDIEYFHWRIPECSTPS